MGFTNILAKHYVTKKAREVAYYRKYGKPMPKKEKPKNSITRELFGNTLVDTYHYYFDKDEEAEAE